MRGTAILVLISILFFPSEPLYAPDTPTQSFNDGEAPRSRTYLGFDANDYPGDTALPALRKTFSFLGYWLNLPPGTKTNSWRDKRDVVLKNGFGFLVLFNGRTESQLKPLVAAALGVSDAELAVKSAQQEGFPAHTIVFLDQEEGGRMLPVQIDYLVAWIEHVNSSGFSAGVYCSGMKVKEGKGHFIVTADDIHERTAAKSFFVYNDACPPSPGCLYLKDPPSPSASGVAYASVWQFAQSPRRREFTRSCSSTYSPDGSCYPPASEGAAANPGSILLDLDSATSPDPSKGRP
jgi:Rv2525c-like, glycoside hydrolase-like domain